MNKIREKVLELASMSNYIELAEHKDLISFCVCSECFVDYEDENNGIEPDFNEVIAVVEKDWLFDYMDMENPLKYLQEEYTSDDSIDWFNEAIIQNKLVMINFN